MATSLGNLGKVLTIKSDDLENLRKTIEAIAAFEVLVGFPENTTARPDETVLTNAELAYIHDNGAPEANIPARPFMLPGIQACEDKIISAMRGMMKQGLVQRVPMQAVKGLMTVGLIASQSIKMKIREGVPPPLSEATLRRRATRGGKGTGMGSRKGAVLELELRAAGFAASTDFAKPLYDTGQLLKAVTFVIRARKRGK